MGNSSNERRVGFLLERTTRILKLGFTRAFGKIGVDITPEQWIILDTLYTKGNYSQVQLAQIIFKNTPTVSRILDILVKKNLVKRKVPDDDRRVTMISITKEGRLLVDKCYPEIQKVRSLSWSDLSEEDFDQFTRILDKVFNNMKSYH